MIYKNFSNILTDHGFVQLDRSIRKNNYKIAYIDNGELKFTDNYDAPIDFNYSKYDKTYPYKESSYWCVVLRNQAAKGEIKKLTTCQEILKYANRGFVVIVGSLGKHQWFITSFCNSTTSTRK